MKGDINSEVQKIVDQILKNTTEVFRKEILPKIKNVKEILYPGQSKQRRYKKNLNKKINIPANIAEDLKKLNA